MITLSTILSAILLCTDTVLGIVVILNKSRNILHRLYAGFVFFIALWIFSNLMVDISTSQTSAMFWSRLALLGPICIAPTFLHFVKIFSDHTANIKRNNSYYLYYLPILLFLPFIFTELNIRNADISVVPPRVQAGPLYYPFAFIFVGYIVYALALLIKGYIKEEGIYKLQLKFLLFGSTATVIWGLFTNLVLLLLGISQASSYGTLGTVFLMVAAWYAITRYRFLNIRFVIGRTLYIILISVIPFVAFYAIYIIQEALWGGIYRVGAFISGFFFSILFIYFLLYTNTRLTRFINSKIINPGFDPVLEKERLVKQMSTELDLHKVVALVSSLFSSTIKSTASGIILFSLDNRRVLYKHVKEFKLDSGLRDLLEIIAYWDEIGASQAIILEEVEMEKPRQTGNTLTRLERIIAFMKKARIAAIFPLNRQVQLNGILLLGTKSDESAFTVQDVNFISSIVANASVAIGRALLYEQVQDFVHNLEKKVDVATQQLEKQAKELRVKNRELEGAARRERDMMDIVGHELRTPATIIKNALGYVQMLRRMKKLSPTKLSSYTNKAQDAVEREIKLINTFLGATKIQGEQMQFDPVKFSLPELIKKVISENRYRAEEKSLKLTYKEAKRGFPPICADQVRIAEVVDNLLSNAIKYTQIGQIELWCEPNLKDKTVTTYIEDTGIGIAKEDMKTLFTKFGRIKNYTTSEKERMAQIVRPGGTGLGLYLVKGVVALHGGTVSVKSTFGKGSTFSFTLPFQCRIAKKNLINPIFSREGPTEVFKKLGMRKAETVPTTMPGTAVSS